MPSGRVGSRGAGVASAVHGGGASVAGHADDFAGVTYAGVDGSHDSQRQVKLVEHRALLDVYLDKTLVVVWVALEFGNVVDAQAGMLHGLAHGDAIGIHLVQPHALEVTCQGA